MPAGGNSKFSLFNTPMRYISIYLFPQADFYAILKEKDWSVLFYEENRYRPQCPRCHRPL